MSVDNILSPEIVERMVALIRRMASSRSDRAWQYGIEWRNTAQTIVALLPKPVDPDLIEARKLVADRYQDHDSQVYVATLRGLDDDSEAVRNALKAIKRGRELAAQESARKGKPTS